MKLFQIFLTLVVFITASWIGFSIAWQKPLWTDEIFSESIDVRSSYWDIITKQNLIEGNKAPVYYFFQKFIENIFSCRLPESVKASGLYSDQKAQIVCRLNSIIWMSLSIAIIFYYFTRYTALWAGVSALLITLSTFMVWCYWAEDRIYAFWFFWTSVQCLAVLWSSQHTHKKSVVLVWLMVTNVLLSLTTTLSIAQVAAVSIWMYFAGYRKITDYIVTIAIPAAICFFYLSKAGHYMYIFVFPEWKMITANIPFERIVMVSAAVLYWGRSSLRVVSAQDRKENPDFLFYLGLMFVAGIGLLLIFKIKSLSHSDERQVMLNGRHLLFLAPLGIIASIFVFVRLMQVNFSRMIKVMLVLLLLVGTVPRIWKYDHFSYDTGGPTILGSVLK